VNRALLHLIYRSLVGRVVVWLRLMRQPRYLIASLVGVAFMGWFALRPFLGLGGNPEMDRLFRIGGLENASDLAPFLPAIQFIAGLAIALALSIWWLLPFGRLALDLKETELHVLLPAPISRRHIIQYALLRNQGGIVFGCLMVSLFTSSRSIGAFLWTALTTWMFLSIWDLHAKGRGLWIARQQELHRRTATAKRFGLIAAIALFWLTLLPALAQLAPAALTPPGPNLGDYIAGTLTNETLWANVRALSLVLRPFLWLIEPLFAEAGPRDGAAGRLLSLVFPAAVLVLQHEWVVRSQARFEEAALARSQRQAASQDAASAFWSISRAGRRRTPFQLAPRGRPEVAIVWKNLMLSYRTPLVRMVLAGLTVMGVLILLIAAGWLPEVVVNPLLVAGLIWTLFVPLVVGPQNRNDLRGDLLRLEIVRTWPLSGWRFFVSEVAAPSISAMLSAAIGCGLLLAIDIGTALAPRAAYGNVVLVSTDLASFLGAPKLLVTPLVLLGLLPLLAAMAFLSTALMNLLVLFVPSWMQLGPAKRGSAAAQMGQQLLIGLVLALAYMIALLPGGILVAAGLAVQVGLLDVPLSAWELPVVGLIMAAPPVLIGGMIVRIGGELWDRLDLSGEILA
jgi:hypothetical protein